MVYRNYGKTGKKTSLSGFGGTAYFNAAPGYFETPGGTVFGEGTAEMRRHNLPNFNRLKEISHIGV